MREVRIGFSAIIVLSFLLFGTLGAAGDEGAGIPLFPID
jgi:hypothetical protein